jgi:hypothetical protein
VWMRQDGAASLNPLGATTQDLASILGGLSLPKSPPRSHPPLTEAEAIMDASCKPLPYGQSIFHMYDGECGNTKYVCDDGRVEAVYRPSGELTSNPNNAGTNNQFGPDYMWGVPHFVVDVIPWFATGSPGGTTSFPDRVHGTYCPKPN